MMPAFAPIVTARTRIVLPSIADASDQLTYYHDNREHFAPWDPVREESFYSLERMARWIADNQDAANRDAAYHLHVRTNDDAGGRMIGTIGIANIVRGAFQAAQLGYSLDRKQTGAGYMHEALTAVIPWAFGPLDLHRLMENYQPGNERSANVLRRLGFAIEGFAHEYLYLDGAWRDHVLTSRVRNHGDDVQLTSR